MNSIGADGQSAGSDVAFLVGAGRSGTTLLYKLLCLHPRVAFISNYESRFGWFPIGLAGRIVAGRIDHKLHAWFNKGGNAYFTDRPWLKKVFPTPNEGESVFASCGLSLFPARDYVPDASTTASLRRKFRQIRRRSGAAVFLSKRTANNRRIRQLSAVFPAARYVHIQRDGREVTQSLSTVEWWDSHKVWWDGRTPVEMERAGEARLAICARNWVREVEELRVQLAPIDPDRVYMLRFEELLSDPIRRLEEVTRFLGLEFTADYRAALESLGLRPVRARWQSEWDAAQKAEVLAEILPVLRQLGYVD